MQFPQPISSDDRYFTSRVNLSFVCSIKDTASRALAFSIPRLQSNHSRNFNLHTEARPEECCPVWPPAEKQSNLFLVFFLFFSISRTAFLTNLVVTAFWWKTRKTSFIYTRTNTSFVGQQRTSDWAYFRVTSGLAHLVKSRRGVRQWCCISASKLVSIWKEGAFCGRFKQKIIKSNSECCICFVKSSEASRGAVLRPDRLEGKRKTYNSFCCLRRTTDAQKL